MTTPLEVISLGAGVQSSTMALMAKHGEISPLPDGAIFADTKGEPQSVYKWLRWLKTQLPYPVYTVSAGSLLVASLTMHETKDGRLYSKTNIPFFTRNHDGSQGKIKHRGCTRDFKLVPLRQKQHDLVAGEIRSWRQKHRSDQKAITALKRWYSEQRAKESGDVLAEMDPQGNFRRDGDGQPAPIELVRAHREAWANCQADPLIVSWIGISLDEATRMKPSREPWIVHRFPLIDLRMTRSDCLAWMLAHGYPEPPRSACVYCPFHNNAEWRRLKELEPKEFLRAVRFEKRLQSVKAKSQKFSTVPYLHRDLVQLTHVDLRTETQRGQLNFFENECEGMCGL